MKKVVSIIAIMIMVLSCLSGCLFMSSEIKTFDYWKISYEKFNGSKDRTIKLSGEGEHTFTIDIVTNSGILGLSIKDKDGTSIYDGEELPTSSFEVKADGAGKYTIRFEGEEHNGSFEVKWE